MQYITIPKSIRKTFSLTQEAPITYIYGEDDEKGKFGKLILKNHNLLNRVYKISKKFQITPPKALIDHIGCPIELLTITSDGKDIYVIKGNENDIVRMKRTITEKLDSGNMDLIKFLKVVEERKSFQLTERNLIQYGVEGDRKTASKIRVPKSLLSECLQYFTAMKISSTNEDGVDILTLPNSDTVRVYFEGRQCICLKYFVTICKLEGSEFNYGV